MRRELALAALAFAASASWAQLADPDPDWKEIEVPSPPALRTADLVYVDVAGGSELRYGVDPQSVAVGQDRVVRFVVVAQSRSGATNAMYEGLRCDRGEYRIYARSSGQAWRPVETEWKSIFEGVEARHVRALARAGACQGHAPNGSPKQIIQDWRSPVGRKFGGSDAP